MRLALCQINPTVGDIAGNVALIRAGIADARAGEADLVLFGELAVTGYPPEDLLLREHFLADAQSALSELAADTHGVVAIVGFPERAEHVYNAAAVLADGAVQAIYRKVHLPNYGVFDERRYFQPGISAATIELGEQLLGLTVCEDIWLPGPPASEEAAAGARLILNISASPYHAGKGAERERMFAERAREDGVPIAFCGLVGGQDELLFDGHSFVVDQHGETIARAAQFSEDLLFCDLDLDGEDGHLKRDPLPPLAVLPGRSPTPRVAHTMRLTEPLAPEEAEIYTALMLGLHDYVEKNGFSHVVLGLSGGIDSALVACLAADALGVERVSAAIMPSPYSSSATQNDARALAGALGVRTHEFEIEPVMDAYTETLQVELAGHGVDRGPDLTEENLQARIRGNLLMALSNKFGWLVLTTGNKSEMSVGYTTLYGDLAGGFAVIKDVPKTLVYRLCEWRNSPAGGSASGTISPRAKAPSSTSARISSKAPAPTSAVIPTPAPNAAAPRANAPIPPSILTRAPSAELRHDQRDEDSLPPYELLDRILYGYIELNHGREQLIAEGLPAAEVDRMIRLVDLAEYKRRQAPPGIKVTTRAFGRDRRMPITNRYRG